MSMRGHSGLGRGRGSAVGSMLLAVVLLVTAIAISFMQRAAHRTEEAARLANAAEQQATLLNNYFERARSAILITSQNPEFAEFYRRPGSRGHKVEAQVPPLLAATRAMAYLENLYPNSIGEACFIDRSGAENARVVRGQVAPVGDLSPDESGNPFFAPTFALEPGQVYQAEPYISPDTGEWVIANSTVIPVEGHEQAMVHFEVTVESFRQAAAQAAIDSDLVIDVIDADTGAVVLDSREEQAVGAPLGEPNDHRFGWVVGATDLRGSVQMDGGLASFVRIPAGEGNANDWMVVATPESAESVLGGTGPGTTALAIASIVLLIIGLFGFRATQKELTKAALTDGLTGLGNRRALLADLEGRFATDPDLTLVMFDLDGFKTYNDTFGHLAGDALLARLARNLEAMALGSATAYRLGGDEFCLLTSAPESVRDRQVEEARQALTEHGEGFLVTASHGWVGRSEAESADEMLHVADKRMYAEKHGRKAPLDTQGRDVLLAALEARYPELMEHAEELVSLSTAIAEELGLDATAVTRVRRAAELHDVGKVAIPDSILRKPGPLTDDEWAFMRRHSEIGERILDATPALAPVGAILRAHHERWDGAGYPDGRAGTEIPMEARIVSVVDAYHAMILRDRPHKDRVTVAEALEELRGNAGTQFDPAVVEAFARSLERVRA